MQGVGKDYFENKNTLLECLLQNHLLGHQIHNSFAEIMNSLYKSN